jgi:CRP-like cAMP-binding protein
MLESLAPAGVLPRAISNARLAALPAQQLEPVFADTHLLSFDRGSVMNDPADATKVFFVEEGLVGLQVMVGNGRSIEAVALGRDAVIGTDVLFGANSGLSCRAVAYTAVVARAIPGRVVSQLMESSAAFRTEIFRAFGEIQMGALRRVACAQFHSVNERVARWLLNARAEIGDSIPVAHAVIADAIGCRRSGVTVALQALREDDVVNYTRGRVRILNPLALVTRACACGPTADQLRYSAAPQ